MDNYNKFKMLTIIFLCLFVFVIAAIYTNTKDASEVKIKENNKQKFENAKEQIQNSEYAQRNNTSDIDNLTVQIEELNSKVDNLIQNNNNNSHMNCQILGIMDSNGESIEMLSNSAALDEAQNNGRTLALGCNC